MSKSEQIFPMKFLGDISLNNKYQKLYEKKDNPFVGLSDHLSESSAIIGNLECLVSGKNGENKKKNPRLKTDIETLNYLSSIGINLVTLAHNHIFDNLEDGFDRTLGFLKEKEIKYLGAGKSQGEASKPIILEENGVKICFLNYVTSDTKPSIPEGSGVAVNLYDREKIINEIKKYKNEVDHIVLLLHWGGRVENGYQPDWYCIKDSRDFVDAGADLIVGHHTHTLQPYEVYKGKHIFYSLGNFCFDDVVTDCKVFEIDRKKNTESVILDVDFLKDDYSVNLIPIRNNNLYIEPDTQVLKRYKRRLFYFAIIKRNKIFWNLYYFKYKYIDSFIFYFWGNDRTFFRRLKETDIKAVFRYLLGRS